MRHIPARIAVLLALAGAAAAQTLTVQNLAPFARREIAAVVVPFARGAVPQLPDLHVEGRATAWQPFGARWPDGSLRQALCMFAVELPALGEQALPLQAGRGPELPTGELAPPPARLELIVDSDAGAFRGELPVVEVLEQNALRLVQLRRARLGGTGLVAELIVQRTRGDAHAYVDVAVFFADPTTPALQRAVREVAIESHGMALLLRHAQRSGVHQSTTADGSRVQLLHDTVLGDGQGIRRCGALVPPLKKDGGLGDESAKAASICPLLGACDWTGTDAFGPYGEPAPLPPWLQNGRLRGMLAARHRAFAQGDRGPGDPFAAGAIGLAKYAGQTGDQEDFGVVKLSLIAGSGVPSMLLEVECSVLQEACRPVHMYDAAGAPLRAQDHPDWIVWSGRTHWHGDVSKDRLGKPVPEPPFEAHGWTGKDREHWSTNTLGAFAQLTGAHWARRELAHEVQLYLSGQTVGRGLSTSFAGAPRGVGRTEQAATWMWLATGDESLLQRMRERIDQVYAVEWTGTTLGADKVRPLGVQGPDDRMLGGKCRYWTPWQDAIAAVGLGAAFRSTGDERARALAEELALNVVRHGWLLNERECIVATAMRWQDGAPLTAAQLGDASAVLWSYGTGFNEWALGACEIARVAATARGDAALAARAAAIQQRVRASRRAPGDGGMDRLGEWDAAHWAPAPAPAK